MMTDKLLIAAALLLAGFSAGWAVQGWRAETRVQTLIASAAEHDRQAAQALATAERANTTRLQQALTAADAAVALAQSRQRAAESTAQETRHTLTLATRADRACLSSDAVRLLNNTPAASHPPGPGLRLPTPPSSAARPAAAPAASERDIAEWIVTARSMYDTCRGRVDAIRG